MAKQFQPNRQLRLWKLLESYLEEFLRVCAFMGTVSENIMFLALIIFDLFLSWLRGMLQEWASGRAEMGFKIIINFCDG